MNRARRRSGGLAVALLLAACSARRPVEPAPASCTLGVEATAVPVEGAGPDERHELLDLPDLPVFWAPAPPDPARDAYRAELVRRLGPAGVEPRALLLRQREVHAALPGDAAREVENADALLGGAAGTIGHVSCLEWLLFQRQDRRFPMLSRPTELGAWVLRGNGRIRVYLSSDDRVGGRLRGEVTDRVAADAARGFVPVAHLHNHPFMFDRRVGDRTWATAGTVKDVGGAVAPSLTDVQLWRVMRERVGLQGGWVTNGLDTSRFGPGDLDRLSAWP